LQQESLAINAIQQRLVDELRSKHKISIGYESAGSIRKLQEQILQQQALRIVESEEDQEVDCRISLGNLTLLFPLVIFFYDAHGCMDDREGANR
jgi:hypothetical protein